MTKLLIGYPLYWRVLHFYLLDAVSRYRDPQLKVGKYFLHL